MHPLSRLTIATLLLATGLARAQVPSCPYGPGALPVETLAPGSPHGDQIPIDHIVVLMQENRSYDHYFGRLRRASGPPRGVTNPDPLGGEPIRTFRQPRFCEVADLPHSWNATHRQMNGGAMDGFTTESVDPGDPTGSRAMGYYTRRELPFYYKLYRTFAISDRFFSSVPGPTYPNRYYLLAGTSFGWIRNQLPDLSGSEYSQRTIFNLLDEAVPAVSWRIYYSDLPFGAIFGYVRQRAANLSPIANFAIDAAAGTLPQVSFVDPNFLNEETGTDEHPPKNMQLGQAFTAEVVNALMASPLWYRSALIIVYDEHGGFYDHVPPPPACVPDDIPPALTPSSEPGAFDMYGVRVPLAIVSPWARKRYVSHVPRDHTTVLRFIQTRFDLPALTRRDANADPLLDMFDFTKLSFTKRPTLPAAVVDPGHTECP